MARKHIVCRNLAKAAALLAANAAVLHAADNPSLEERLNALESQNRSLREELASQKKLIEELRDRNSARSLHETPDPVSKAQFKLGRLHISGEGGVDFTLGVKGLPKY